MNTLTLPAGRRLPFVLRDSRARLLLLVGLALTLTFWFASRYPALLHKSDQVGQSVASMAYSSPVWTVAGDAALWEQILAGTVNWLAAMRVGMTFGVLFGALLHTTLRYFPLRLSSNLTLNSMKGALVGVPMGVCANCAVPTACGVTRGNGRLEVALGFLFSSPNFNPVVILMTVTALPPAMVAAKYAVLLALIVLAVPMLVGALATPADPEVAGLESEACSLPLTGAPRESQLQVARELGAQFLRHVWMLTKPTLAIMLVASLASSTALALIPIDALLSDASGWRLGAASLLATLMPVPIALDVLFAAQIQAAGAAPGYVMLFAMTLGTFSIVPAIYLWREVSRKLALALLALFFFLGWGLGLVFQSGLL
jgi:uncharacterized membrane protein YraQ (UPF0718 family)